MNYDAEYHEDLMKGWLMLADIFIKSEKKSDWDSVFRLCNGVVLDQVESWIKRSHSAPVC